MDNEQKGREFRQEETQNLQKSERPDAKYMQDRHLCTVCHGVARVCERGDCPQRGIGG